MLFQRSQFLVSLGALICFSVSVWAAPARISVVGPDGKPLANAKVAISERLDLLKILPTRELLTDQNGALTLELDEGTAPRHSYAARVLAPGLAVAGGEIRAGETKFALQAGQSWSGVILDAAQKPVEGVKVFLIGWRAEKLENLEQNTVLDADLGFTATTDAQGRYGFGNLPLTGRANIMVLDPRFQGGSYSLDLSQKEAPPLFVRAGGTVAGRAVLPDGKPLGEAEIAVLNGGAFQNAKTATDGAFSIGGLKPDANSLRSFSVKDGWVLKELAFEPVKAGETRRVPDWVATRALEVTGQLVDAATKKSLSGVTVEVQADATGFTTTDAQGRFKTYSSRDVHFLRVRDENHLEKTIQQISIPPAAASYDFGTIALAPGARISGTVRDENGQSPRLFYFQIENKDKSISQFVSSENGVISPVVLPAGTYDLVSPETEIVSPKTLAISAGTKATALQVVAKTETRTLAKTPSLTGRVVDEGGQPVAGALVKFKGIPSMGIGTIEAISGSDGRFSELFYGDEKPEFLGIERPGYILGEAKAIAQIGAEWQLGEVALQRGGQIFRGRVLQAGKPVANARVALAGNNWREPAQTDASGAFEFEDLPRGEMELLAAGDSGFASLKTRGDAADVTLNLLAAPEVNRAKLANGLVPEQPNRGDWRLGWEIFGAPAMETIALRGDKALDAQNQPIPGKGGYNLSVYFSDIAARDPARLLERGPQLLPIFRAGTAKTESATILARVQAASGDTESQNAARAWLEAEKNSTSVNPVQNVKRLLALTEVATSLKRPDAAVFFDMALNFAAQLPLKTQRDNADVWGALTARIGPAALESLLQDLDVVSQFTALSTAIRIQARGGDLISARLNLTKLEALQLAPEIKVAAQAEPDARSQRFESGRLLARARAEVARALAPTDAAGALGIAQSIEGDFKFIEGLNVLLEIAQVAAKSGNNEVAKAALREVSASRLSSGDPGARAGAIAMSFDLQLGAQLFQKALAQTAPNEQNARYQPTVATWSFESAPFDAALARAVLEREWSWRLPAYQTAEAAQKANGEHNYHESHLGYLAWAMSQFDPTRALEWANALPAKSYGHGQAKALIAVTLLAAPEQRQNFNRYLNWEAPDY